MLATRISNWNIHVIQNAKIKSTSRPRIKTNTKIVSPNRHSISHTSLKRSILMKKSEVELHYHLLLRKGRLCLGRIVRELPTRNITLCSWTIIFLLRSFLKMIMFLRLNMGTQEWTSSIIRFQINLIWRI